MVTVELRSNPDLWLITLSGSIPTDELLGGLRRLGATPEASTTVPILMDGRAITDAHDNAAHMTEIADAIPVGPPGGREGLLVIVASRDVDYGNARVFEARFASQLRREVRVVRTWSDAVSALRFTAEQLPDPLRTI